MSIMTSDYWLSRVIQGSIGTVWMTALVVLGMSVIAVLMGILMAFMKGFLRG